MNDFVMKIFYLIIFLFPLNQIVAQDYLEPGWSFNYFGEFYNHPGIKLGYEKGFSQKIKTKVKNDITHYTHKQRIGKLSMVYYYHKNNHHGIILLPEIEFKKVRHSGFFRSWSYGLGIHQSILPGPIFRQNQDGSFNSSPAGQTTGIMSVDLSFGRDLRFAKGKDYSWHFGIGGNIRFPFNGFFLPGTFLHLGFTYYPTYNTEK